MNQKESFPPISKFQVLYNIYVSSFLILYDSQLSELKLLWIEEQILTISIFKSSIETFVTTIIFSPCIPRRQRLQRVIKIYHNFIQREEVFKHNSIFINKNHIFLNCSSCLKKKRSMIIQTNTNVKR